VVFAVTDREKVSEINKKASIEATLLF